MSLPLLIHIAAGGVGIVSGFVAAFAAKGGRLHRRGGVVFFWSMMTMGLFGAGLAARKSELGNLTAGVLTAYMVLTAMTTVRPSTPITRRVGLGAMLVGVATGLASIALGMQALTTGGQTLDGVPARVIFMFSAIALGSALGDARMMRAGGYTGPRRLRRHLWRMCFSLFIASTSFFLGQADEFPERFRVFPLLAIPAFLPLVVMVYWLWRVRVRRTPRNVAGTDIPRPAVRPAARQVAGVS